MNGIDLINIERERQIKEEGYNSTHDDNIFGLAVAGACYALSAEARINNVQSWSEIYLDVAKKLWPYDEDYWKPKDNLKDLVRAGALIAAAIDKSLRSEKVKS